VYVLKEMDVLNNCSSSLHDLTS